MFSCDCCHYCGGVIYHTRMPAKSAILFSVLTKWVRKQCILCHKLFNGGICLFRALTSFHPRILRSVLSCLIVHTTITTPNWNTKKARAVCTAMILFGATNISARTSYIPSNTSNQMHSLRLHSTMIFFGSNIQCCSSMCPTQIYIQNIRKLFGNVSNELFMDLWRAKSER